MIFFLGIFFTSVLILLLTPPFRRLFLTGPIFHFTQKRAPRISSVERQTISIGSPGFDSTIFSGNPNWKFFRSLPLTTLTEEENAYIKGPTDKLCAQIDDWQIRGVNGNIPDSIWHTIKKEGFLGLRIPKSNGGKGFSAEAQSVICGRIASRSIDTSILVEVPNSLGPDELIGRYGTNAQKEHYLKRFATGEEVPCFAVTSASGGSDIGSMRDVGIVTKEKVEGAEILGVRVTWSKRYITLAPKATVLVLAFTVRDPEKILKNSARQGISLALIPVGHPGVNIGKRHRPGGSAFPNGPTWGNEVFIPLEWIIGGEAGIGKGWTMVMESLAAGRGISVPSMSVAAIKFLLLVTSAYSVVRRQFGKSIGEIEGVEEVLGRMIEMAYIGESARSVTATLLDEEGPSLSLASIMKYKMTEYARQVTNDAMDIHGGKGVMDGPSNYLQSFYQMVPVAITAEGSNIITRSLIITGQSVMSAHPYFRKELELLETSPTPEVVHEFDRIMCTHIALFIGNIFSGFFHNFTFGFFANSADAPRDLQKWYRQLSRSSRNFAIVADILIFVFQSQLKKRQYIGGRLADALSELYLLASTLKRYENDRTPAEDRIFVELVMHNGLMRFDKVVDELIHNLENKILQIFLRVTIFPFGSRRRSAPDRIKSAAVKTLLNSSSVRERMTRYTYIPEDVSNPVKTLEEAYRYAMLHREPLRKFERSLREGQKTTGDIQASLAEAQQTGVLTSQEREGLEQFYRYAERSIAVDSFD